MRKILVFDIIFILFSMNMMSQVDSTSVMSGILTNLPPDAVIENESPADNKDSKDEIWKPFATTVHAGLNLSDLTGDGAKGIHIGLGQQLGISVDFLNNKPIGVEGDILFNRYVMSVESGDYKATASSLYLELMLLVNARVFIKKIALEADLGISGDWGLWSNVQYKDKNIPSYSLFKGNKYSDGMIKGFSGMFVYGITFKYEKAQLRLLMHQGFPNISKSENNKIKLLCLHPLTTAQASQCALWRLCASSRAANLRSVFHGF